MLVVLLTIAQIVPPVQDMVEVTLVIDKEMRKPDLLEAMEVLIANHPGNQMIIPKALETVEIKDWKEPGNK